jgi:hydrogenase maturation protease
MRAVILGIGNVLLSDESVGVRALEALNATYRMPPEVSLVDGGTSGMELLEDIEGADLLIVLDAVRANREPGTLIRLANEEVPVFFRTKLSPHQIGLSDVLANLEFLGRLPREVVVLGVEPFSLETRLELSEPVAARLPELVNLAVAELEARGLAPLPRAPATVS